MKFHVCKLENETCNILLREVNPDNSGKEHIIEPSMEGLKGLLEKHPDVIDDNELVSLYYSIMYQQFEEFLTARAIVSWVEAEITGHTTTHPMKKMLDLVGDGFSWIDLNTEEQIEIVAKNIRENLNKS